jgi:hypothetical protein
MMIYFIIKKMCKLILTIICIIALNNFIIVTPAVADANIRRLCLYDYNAGEDWISIRWGDSVRSTTSDETFSPADIPTGCFFGGGKNWWMSITQDARLGSNSRKFYKNVPNPNERFIDRQYWHINTYKAGDANQALIEATVNQNFQLPIDTDVVQRPGVPGATYTVDREINNYFLSFFPAYPSMKHRLSYVVSGIEEDDEGSNTMKCGTAGTGDTLYPHFRAKLKLYGSAESARSAFNALDKDATSTTIIRNIYYDHMSKIIYPLKSAAGEDYTTDPIYIKTALCVKVEGTTTYLNAYVVHWWTGKFKYGFDQTVNEAGRGLAGAQCFAGSTGAVGLCTTTPAQW